jgi:hypothetical protein
MIPKLSCFELMCAFHTPDIVDDITPAKVKKMIVSTGYHEESTTPSLFYKYIESLPPFILRMFLYFVCSRTSNYNLSTIENSHLDEAMIAIYCPNITQGTHIASMKVSRTFSCQVGLPDYNDYELVRYNVSEALLECFKQSF